LRLESALCLGLRDAGQLAVIAGRGVLRLSSSISAGVWTPAEKQLIFAFISPPIEVGDFC